MLSKALRSVRLFAECTEEEFASIGRIGQAERFPPGRTILKEGEANHRLWLILSGEAEVVRHVGGKPFVLSNLRAGDFFGEISMFEAILASATVNTKTEVECATLDRGALERLLPIHPGLAVKLLRAMMREMTARLRRANHRLVEGIIWVLPRAGFEAQKVPGNGL